MSRAAQVVYDVGLWAKWDVPVLCDYHASWTERTESDVTLPFYEVIGDTVLLSEWVSEWVSEWASEWVSKWVNEWVSEWVSEWMNEWVSE